jgi:hypothetical protein
MLSSHLKENNRIMVAFRDLASYSLVKTDRRFRADIGSSNHLWNVGQFLADYTVQHPPPPPRVVLILAVVRTWNPRNTARLFSCMYIWIYTSLYGRYCTLYCHSSSECARMKTRKWRGNAAQKAGSETMLRHSNEALRRPCCECLIRLASESYWCVSTLWVPFFVIKSDVFRKPQHNSN